MLFPVHAEPTKLHLLPRQPACFERTQQQKRALTVVLSSQQSSFRIHRSQSYTLPHIPFWLFELLSDRSARKQTAQRRQLIANKWTKPTHRKRRVVITKLRANASIDAFQPNADETALRVVFERANPGDFVNLAFRDLQELLEPDGAIDADDLLAYVEVGHAGSPARMARAAPHKQSQGKFRLGTVQRLHCRLFRA